MILWGACYICGAFYSSGGGDSISSLTVTRFTLLLLPLSLDFDLTDLFYFFRVGGSARSTDFSAFFAGDSFFQSLDFSLPLPFAGGSLRDTFCFFSPREADFSPFLLLFLFFVDFFPSSDSISTFVCTDLRRSMLSSAFLESRLTEFLRERVVEVYE